MMPVYGVEYAVLHVYGVDDAVLAKTLPPCPLVVKFLRMIVCLGSGYRKQKTVVSDVGCPLPAPP